MTDKAEQKGVTKLDDAQLDEATGGALDRSYTPTNFNLSLNSTQTGLLSKVDPNALLNAKK